MTKERSEKRVRDRARRAANPQARTPAPHGLKRRHGGPVHDIQPGIIRCRREFAIQEILPSEASRLHRWDPSQKNLSCFLFLPEE